MVGESSWTRHAATFPSRTRTVHRAGPASSGTLHSECPVIVTRSSLAWADTKTLR